MKIYLGYLDQSSDDLEIVSERASLVISHLKGVLGNEFEDAYVDVWSCNTLNIERIPLVQFQKNIYEPRIKKLMN